MSLSLLKVGKRLGLRKVRGEEVEGKVELHGFSVDRFSFIS